MNPEHGDVLVESLEVGEGIALDGTEKSQGKIWSSFYTVVGKRWMDAVISFLSLIILFPFFLVIALMIVVTCPGPVFFRQERVGRRGRRFKLVKFRTMVNGAHLNGSCLTSSRDKRVTSLGRFLRRYKIDEAPQLWNILKGEMSIVGPRPELPQYVELFQEDYKEILSVRPGLTDHALIVFREEEKMLSRLSSMEDGYVQQIMPLKITLYKAYIRDIRSGSDLKIFLKTAVKVLQKG